MKYSLTPNGFTNIASRTWRILLLEEAIPCYCDPTGFSIAFSPFAAAPLPRGHLLPSQLTTVTYEYIFLRFGLKSSSVRFPFNLSAILCFYLGIVPTHSVFMIFSFHLVFKHSCYFRHESVCLRSLDKPIPPLAWRFKPSVLQIFLFIKVIVVCLKSYVYINKECLLKKR